jgi:hypothetical protein
LYAILGEKVHNLSSIGTSGRSRNVALNLQHLNAFYFYIKAVMQSYIKMSRSLEYSPTLRRLSYCSSPISRCLGHCSSPILRRLSHCSSPIVK